MNAEGQPATKVASGRSWTSDAIIQSSGGRWNGLVPARGTRASNGKARSVRPGLLLEARKEDRSYDPSAGKLRSLFGRLTALIVWTRKGSG